MEINRNKKISPRSIGHGNIILRHAREFLSAKGSGEDSLALKAFKEIISLTKEADDDLKSNVEYQQLLVELNIPFDNTESE